MMRHALALQQDLEYSHKHDVPPFYVDDDFEVDADDKDDEFDDTWMVIGCSSGFIYMSSPEESECRTEAEQRNKAHGFYEEQ